MIPVNIIPLTDLTTRKEERNQAQTQYEEEGCGICQQKGAEVFWVSPFSRSAHRVCIQKLAKFGIETELNEIITKYSHKHPSGYNHTYHLQAIETVNQRLNGRTITQVLEDGSAGVARLKFLFNVAASRLEEFLFLKSKK